MTVYYYLGWFNKYFPEKLASSLSQDIVMRHSITMISSDPMSNEVSGFTERSWLQDAGILFNEYHLINHQVKKEDAQRLIEDASVIFLLGGDAIKQNMFLKEYELLDAIQNHKGIIMGASAGAINMSSKWLCSPNFGYDITKPTIYNGLSLHDFSVLSHFDLENNMEVVKRELAFLSEELPVYISNKDCAIRVQGKVIDVLGDVFLYSRQEIHKLDETIY